MAEYRGPYKYELTVTYLGVYEEGKYTWHPFVFENNPDEFIVGIKETAYSLPGFKKDYHKIIRLVKRYVRLIRNVPEADLSAYYNIKDRSFSIRLHSGKIFGNMDEFFGGYTFKTKGENK